MLNIRFKGIIKNEDEIKKNSKLYENSVMFKEEATIREHIKKSEKITLITVAMIMISTLIIAELKNIELEFHLTDVAIGILMIIPLILIFEIILVLTYPLNADKDIYIIPKNLAVLLVSNSLVSKKRFILTRLLLLMSIVSCIITPTNCINMYNTIKQVPKGAKVFNYGVHSYWVNNKN